MMRTRGFTLVELLVVIAIICLLVAIFLPALARAREKGRQAACTANQQQIAAMITLCADEHQEIYPDGGTGLISDVWKSIKINKRILACPSTDIRAGGISYTYSGFVAGKGMAEVKEPVEEMLLTDGNGGVFNQPTDFDCRHAGGMITAFCDGHVEYMTEPPPMWLVHLTTPSEFDFEVKKSRFPVVLFFLHPEIYHDPPTAEDYANMLIRDTVTSIARDYRLKAKIVIEELQTDDESILRTDLHLPTPGHMTGYASTDYPIAVFFYQGKQIDVMLPPFDGFSTPTIDKLLEWWNDHIEKYQQDLYGKLNPICDASSPWLGKEK